MQQLAQNLPQEKAPNKLTYEELHAPPAEHASPRSTGQEDRRRPDRLQFQGRHPVGRHARTRSAITTSTPSIRRSRLPRQKSAMLPILDQTIEGQKFSIYNESIHAKYPLLGLKLEEHLRPAADAGTDHRLRRRRLRRRHAASSTAAQRGTPPQLRPRSRRRRSRRRPSGAKPRAELPHRRRSAHREVRPAANEDLHDQEPLDA